MVSKIAGEKNLFETLNDLNHDPSRGQPHQVQVVKGIYILATFHEVGYDLGKVLTKQGGQFAFHMIRPRSEGVFRRAFTIKFFHTQDSFLRISQ
jgi:hypothetical protein